MRVFYVTATHHSAPTRPGVDGPVRERAELGKFFVRAHAEVHLADLHREWQDARIEERDEPKDVQHILHGGKIGG